MENKIFNRAWKNEELWKNIRNTSIFLAFGVMFISGFDQEIFRTYYELVALALIGIFAIANTLIEIVNKEIHELKKYIFWRIIVVVILISIFALSLIPFPNNEKIYSIALLIFLVLFIIMELFKERLRISKKILKYLVDDEPSWFTKRYFVETRKGTIVLHITLILFIIVWIVFIIGFSFFQWETFFNFNS